MSGKITDLESIIEPVSLLFRRARETGNNDVATPNNMHFGANNAILLSWNLTDRLPQEALDEFEKIKKFAQTTFEIDRREDIGVSIYTGRITWHGDYPEVHFKVFISTVVLV